MKETEIKALITLLDDPSRDVFETVTVNLINKGTVIIPDLEKAWENSDDELHQERLEDIIRKIQYNHSIKAFRNWIGSGHKDLLMGVYLLARFRYPDLQYSEVTKQIEKIGKDVWIELNDNLTALEKVRILNHIIFDIHGFTRNSGDFYDPLNSFINKVLDTRQGNPISLAIVYSVVAQRLELPIFGVNLPRNFILAFRDDYDRKNDQPPVHSEEILFYINPYNKGAVHSRREIDYFLKEQKIRIKKSYFLPCTNLDIVERILNNLINAYERLRDEEKVKLFRGIRRELPKGQ